MKKHTCFFLSIAFFLFANLTNAQTTKTFTNASGDGAWLNPNNWSPVGVPDVIDDVIIPPSVTVQLNNNHVQINRLENNGFLEYASSIESGTLVNSGSIAAREGSELLFLVRDNIENNGLITCDSNGVSLFVGDQVNNSGLLKNVNFIQSGTLINSGSISGWDYSGLWIEAADNIENDGIISCDSNGISLSARNRLFNNLGTIHGGYHTWIDAASIDNNNNIFSRFGLTISSNEQFYNFGKIASCDSNGVPFIFQGDININCINPEGTALFYNMGTIQGGNGAPGMGGDNIYFHTDDFRNRGFINAGLPGNGFIDPGGNVSVFSNKIDNAGVIYSPFSEISFLCQVFRHNPVFNDSPKKSAYNSSDMVLPMSEFFKIEADAVFIEGKELSFGNMGAFGSGTTLIGTQSIYVSNTNNENAFMDFSENNFAGTIVSENLISFLSNNLIEPAGGLANLCSIPPQINAGGTDSYGGLILAEDFSDSSGISGQIEAFFKNQCSFAKDFSYSISSVLGWVEPVTAQTGMVESWDIFTFSLDYEITENLAETTVDTVSIEVIMSEFSTLKKSILITGIPGGTVSVEDNINELPNDFYLYQNYPNPFNPTTTIKYALPAVETGYIPSLQHVSLKIFDILGREVATLVEAEKPAGTYSITWNAESLPSGVYFYKLTSGNFTDVKKMILLR
ncbi:MAG: T9SS type A sorting domain-containing protein [bacterium]